VRTVQARLRLLPAQAADLHWSGWGLFACLSCFTLLAGDGSLAYEWSVSAVFLLFAACVFVRNRSQISLWSLPATCLLCFAAYGLMQTLFSPRALIYDGSSQILFWFTAAVIVMVGSSSASSQRSRRCFLTWFVWFGTAECVLDLLQQASHTDRFFWLILSRMHSVSGSFGYWNNFSQFVELVFPVSLWLALWSRPWRSLYLALSAVQLAAVAASGSRAGSVLLVVELLVVLFFARREGRRKLAGAAISICLLGFALIWAAGTNQLFTKLKQQDQLAVRRNINRSSWAMFREHPLTGWGLGTYTWVYPRFASYDDGTVVNRAHNDWAQWATEGGVPAVALMAVIVAWSARRVTRSVWSLGVLALAVHALVDYPFARLGTCGWYFALLGLLGAQSRKERRKSPPVRDLIEETPAERRFASYDAGVPS
jgi:O-antigen ligase